MTLINEVNEGKMHNWSFHTKGVQSRDHLFIILGVKSNYKYTGFKKMEYMTKFKPNQQ